MKVMRRILGLLVVLAGLLGLVLSLGGLITVWVAKPTVASYAKTTIDVLDTSITTSQTVMEVTRQALRGTIDSVDALSAMLSTTAAAVKDTEPVLDKVNLMMTQILPSTLQATTDALYSAQQAARVLESTIQQLDAFRLLISATPLMSGLLPPPGEAYNPEKPMADSLGELASNLKGLPDTFIRLSTDLSATDDKLATVQDNLITMSESVKLISSSLGEYERMVTQSKSSLDNLMSILTSIRNNLPTILNVAAVVLTLLFSWLLAAQVVILSQGWELYQGTADRLES
ncbi:MAG: hypothetical protein ACUVWZ_10505 [Anaerolineae bacterium]